MNSYTSSIRIKLFLAFLVLICFQYVSAQTKKSGKENADALNESMNRLTDVIVHDIFSPPVSSRIYAYTTIAAYEAMQPGYKNLESAVSHFQNLSLNKNHKGKICYPLAGITALFETAKAFTFSEDLIHNHFDTILKKYFTDVSQKTLLNSMNYGKAIATQIIQWSSNDNYRTSRTFERYQLLKSSGSWEPTPPDYADAVEPYWGTMRTFFLDSAAQCKPPSPTVFSTESRSAFYEQALTLYDASKVLTEDQKETVFFWDDNPAVTKLIGHLTYLEKKPGPAGHWIGITQIAIKKTNTDIISAAQIYMLVSIALADGFISCWKEKYTSQTIRPETYINKYIDASWKPLLQTPPFPEYTSGHSVISHAAAEVLSQYFGDHFSYIDSSSYYYGIKPRQFNSFLQAADEASMSRFFGGIHFIPALENGSKQGIMVGDVVLQKMKKK